MLALVDGVPRTLNLAQVLTHYVAHQIEVVTRRTEFRLRKARARAHIVEGLLRAIDMLDAVIAAIRASDDRPAARAALMAEPFSFSEEQANHILDMTLGRLTRLGRTELEEEMAKLRETIAELEAILADPAKLRGVIATEMSEIRDKFANERRSVITHDPGELGVEDLIDDEEMVVTMTAAGYIKSVPAVAFRTQGRGGRGVQGARLKEEDLVTHVVHTTAHCLPAALLQPGPGLPAAGPRDPDEGAHGQGHGPGQPAAAGDRARRSRPSSQTRDFPADQYLVFATARGQVKKTAFSRVRQVPAGGLHRHQPARRRRAGPGGRHHRGRRPLRGDPQGHDHPVLRERRPGHGPRRRRGPGHPAPRGRRGGVPRRGPGRRRHPDGHRRRLRQADQAGALQPPGPRRPGRPGHPADGQAGPGGGRLHGRRSTRRSCWSPPAGW